MTMTFANTKEEGLETLIVNWLVQHNGYEQGVNKDYNKEYALDESRLFRFLNDTQPVEMEKLGVNKSSHEKRKFLCRLSNEITNRGIIDVLRNGIRAYPAEKSCSKRIFLVLHANYDILSMPLDWHWICVYSLTAFRLLRWN